MKMILDDEGKSTGKEDPEYDTKVARYRMLLTKYLRCDTEYKKLVKSWKNNHSRMFAIVLQHCPPDLVQRLKSKDMWAITKDKLDVIALTKMIRDVAHAHDDTTQGTMAIVPSDMILYTSYMSKSETPASFCCTFQANVGTINTHGGSAGRHPKLFDKHVARLMSKRDLASDDSDGLEKASLTQNVVHVTSILHVCSFWLQTVAGTRDLSEPWITSTLWIMMPIGSV